jgi:hypothetical protein
MGRHASVMTVFLLWLAAWMVFGGVVLVAWMVVSSSGFVDTLFSRWTSHRPTNRLTKALDVQEDTKSKHQDG